MQLLAAPHPCPALSSSTTPTATRKALRSWRSGSTPANCVRMSMSSMATSATSPEALLKLFGGENTGKLIIALNSPSPL
jgi:hypothetical protein